MIVTDCNITVNGSGQSVADKNIYVYIGDFNVQVTFTITQANDYRYRSSDAGENLIESTNASYAQVIIKNSETQGVVQISDVAPTDNGKVTLTIVREYIDETFEAGSYDYQIRLFSSEQHARLTIPPVVGQLIVREPLVSGDKDTNIVNFALVDHAMVLTNAAEELPVFDEEGNYIKTEWYGGDVISAERLNKIENAIFLSHDSCITDEELGNIIEILEYINNGGDDDILGSYDEETENLTISGTNEPIDEDITF
jgi:hypothetical protein